MRVLVTGGAGYIGSVMVRMLEKEGHQVTVADSLENGHRLAVTGARADLEVIDLVDLEEITEVCREYRPEICMHFAAHSLVGESVEKPLKYFYNNVVGGLNLLKALMASGCKSLVFSSTAALFGIPERVPIEEDDPRRPINPYGHSKLILERIFREVSTAGDFRYVALRYFNASGADVESDLGEDHNPESHLIPRVIKAALGKEPRAVIFGTDYPTRDGTCVRDYIHILDLCRAHMLALDYLSEKRRSEVFNLGNGHGFTVREVIDSVQRVSGRQFEVVEGERRPGDPPSLVASSSRIGRVLGWEPGIGDLDQIVGTAWEWHSRHPDGYS